MRKRGDFWQVSVHDGHGNRVQRQDKSWTYEQALVAERALLQELKKTKLTSLRTVGEIVSEYLEWVRLHQSPITHRNKKWYLFGYLLPFFGNMYLDSINSVLIDKYKAKRKVEIKAASKGGNRQINLELLCLSHLTRWAADHNPPYCADALKLEKLPYTTTLPDILNRGELWKLLEVADTKQRALLLCLFQAGLRRNEALSLTWRTVSFSNKSLMIENAKRDKSRIVPMSPILLDALKRLRDKKRDMGLVFPSPVTGGQYTDIRKIIEGLKKKAGITKRVTPHLLRHCFGTYILETSGDLRAVQVLLGHENIKTTTVYTHLSMERLRNIVDRLDCTENDTKVNRDKS